MTRSIVIVLFALFACDEGKRAEERKPVPPPVRVPQPPATAEQCDAAAKGDLGSPGGTGLGPGADAELRAKREPAIVRLCREDKWPADAADCFAKAQGLMGLGDCFHLLPGQASQRLTDEMQSIMKRALGVP